MLQPTQDIEKWYSKEDPWEYEVNPDDQKRKEILLSEIPERKYTRVLDVGCGNGFVTRELPGREVFGVDISENAVSHATRLAKPHHRYISSSLFDLRKEIVGEFDLIVITGVLYDQYIGNSLPLVYLMVDDLLAENGVLLSVHIDEWYKARFPYLLNSQIFYDYRSYTHRLEVYLK